MTRPAWLQELIRRVFPHPWRTVLCAIVRDEALYLHEWAAYHLAIGFDRIVLYDNDSSEAVASLFRHGRWPRVVTVVPWPTPPVGQAQLAAYENFLACGAAGADWVAFLDADEFLNLKRHASLRRFLSSRWGGHAIGINWRIFGSGGARERKSGLVIERFTRAAHTDFEGHRHVKTLARTVAIHSPRVHSHSLWPGATFVSPDGTPRDTEPNVDQRHVDLGIAQINHYFAKSAAEFALKRDRGRADTGLDDPRRFRVEADFVYHDRNEDEDVSILRWRRALLRKLRRMHRGGRRGGSAYWAAGRTTSELAPVDEGAGCHPAGRAGRLVSGRDAG